MFEDIDAFINFINSHGGFKVIGWYKRGIINDQSPIVTSKINYRGNINGNANNTNIDIFNNDMQVDYGDISYHFVHIPPINRNLLDYTTGIGQKILSFKSVGADTKNMQNKLQI